MGYKVVWGAIEFNRRNRMPKSSAYLLVTLAEWANNEEFECQASIAQICERNYVTRSQAFRDLRKLEEEHAIERRNRGGGRHRHTVYRLIGPLNEQRNVDSDATLSAETVPSGGTLSATPLDKTVPHRATLSAETVPSGGTLSASSGNKTVPSGGTVTRETVAFQGEKGRISALAYKENRITVKEKKTQQSCVVSGPLDPAVDLDATESLKNELQEIFANAGGRISFGASDWPQAHRMAEEIEAGLLDLDVVQAAIKDFTQERQGVNRGKPFGYFAKWFESWRTSFNAASQAPKLPAQKPRVSKRCPLCKDTGGFLYRTTKDHWGNPQEAVIRCQHKEKNGG